MTRIRLSTTVDATLLRSARGVRSGVTDAALTDEALAALLARHRCAEVDAGYAAYDERPLDEPDEWGLGVVPTGRGRLVGELLPGEAKTGGARLGSGRRSAPSLSSRGTR